MKTTLKHIAILGFLWVLILPSVAKNGAQEDENHYILVKGKVIDQQSDAPLVFATIAVNNSNLATVSNSEGRFTIKVPNDMTDNSLSISYIGYETVTLPLSDFKNNRTEIIRLEGIPVKLNELSVFPDQPEIILDKVLENKHINYPSQPNLMTSFYRETIKKRKQYTALAEAVVDIYKPSYTDSRSEQIKLLKGRKGVNVSKMDTVLFKLQGGTHSMLSLDVVKYPYSIISKDIQANYDYRFSGLTRVDGEIHLIITFEQKKEIIEPMFYGTLYIHAETMAISRATFSLNTENKYKASKIFIRKKPLGCDVYPVFANYMVNYRRQGDKWYYSYARGEVAFKIDWEKRLFGTTYTTSSELAVTNRTSTEHRPFRGQERLKSNAIMTESVSGFYDKAFWGEYNVIEPEKSINTAIKKIAKNMKQLD